MKKMLSVLAAAIFVMGVSGQAFAAKKEIVEKVNIAKSTYENFDKKLSKAKSDLNLTADQSAKIDALDADLKAKQKDAKKKISNLKTEKVKLLASKDFEGAKAKDAAISQTETSLKNAQTDYIQAVSQVLTPEQSQKLDTALQDAVKRK
ncbi:Spy/CpxP family protein refolding chaperone [Endomicrobium proavitum]|uniref:Uncharacterized protein n=1 Tax=Endomicrobium proavitum TaxID=1408281 RepID=A0A0G3WIT0_9BACT|nr:Spy/CpxP family protein refolding chaperone [Endomicrobium proavitum]AKL98551.1 exported protein of unknown function [Endomicrobium proavitum]